MTSALTGRGGIPPGTRVVLDTRTRSWRDHALVLGGSPWRVVRLSPAARDLVVRLHAAGAPGLVVSDRLDVAAADALVERGFVHPAPLPRKATGVAVVIPAYGRPDRLAECLASLGTSTSTGTGTGVGTGVAVVVVDDASPDAAAIAEVAEAHGATLLRHAVNQGPGAARNTGIAAIDAKVIAFLDSDCTAGPGWLDALLPHFDDPRVVAVAPRVLSRPGQDRSVLARHEAARSALDMGRRRELVRPGGPLGFVPSAALLVRRAALDENGAFEPALRLGEDVDLVWRLAAAGGHVRYEPAVVVHHDARLRFGDWLRRRYDYGTSAADLDRRHPGLLAPAKPSAWNLAALALLVTGRPVAATAVAGAATLTLGRRLRRSGAGTGLAAVVVGTGVVADGVAVGHALRREWWPLGWAALAASRRSRFARAGAVAMLAPIALEWLRERPAVDPPRYLLLRLAEDAAYGTGVLTSAGRGRRPRALLPLIRLPGRR